VTTACKARLGTCEHGACCTRERGKRRPREPREVEIQQAIRLAIGLEPGVAAFRNNVGVAKHADGRRVAYGVGGPGGSDLIGLCDGRFVALECKRPGEYPTAEQAQFLECVRANGGFAAVVRSVSEASAALVRCRAGEFE
jgi:hypothetical protein